MLVELADVIKFLDANEEEETKIVSTIQNSAEKAIKDYCHREFEAALYVKERHDGDKQDTIYFDQSPVIAVNLDELAWSSTGKTVTRKDGGSFVTDGFAEGDKVLIQNSDSNSGLFTCSTGSSGVVALSITFDEAVVDDTVDDNVILSHFRELWVNDSEIDEDNYEVNKDHIYYPGGFLKGHRNVRMTYYAGYSPSNMPEDLQLAVKIMTKYFYQKRNEESYGVKDYWIGDMKVAAEDKEFPKEVFALLGQYRKYTI